uniref:protein FAM187B-like n=1 Tax=Pristiophorus japonicus TaxID=55135 RepID=UPI00398F2A3C
MLGLWPAVTVALLLSRAPATCAGGAIPCLPYRPCQIPLVTRNPATLLCPNAPPGQSGGVSWTYSSSSEPGSRAVTVAGAGADAEAGAAGQDLRWRCELRGTNLRVASPAVRDSGVYLCRAGDKTLAYYEADFQDSGQLHVSGKRPALASRRLELGGRRLEMFTLWNSWEHCNRCGAPGERRRLGFCYLRSAGARDVPCGLAALPKGQKLPPRGPELALEPCRVPCAAPGAELYRLELPGRQFVSLNDSRVLLFETYLVNIRGNVTFRCPQASLYSPVSWQRNGTADLSSPPGGSHWLDQATGGATYTITGAQLSDRGAYKCFVDNRLAASFHLRVLDPFRRRRAVSATATGLIWYTLSAIAAISALLVLLTFLYTYCSQIRRHQIVHW